MARMKHTARESALQRVRRLHRYAKVARDYSKGSYREARAAKLPCDMAEKAQRACKFYKSYQRTLNTARGPRRRYRRAAAAAPAAAAAAAPALRRSARLRSG